MKRHKLSIGFFSSVILLLFTVPAFSQQKIRGTVLNEKTDLPLSGVTILLPATKEGTFTNEKGLFELTTDQSFPVKLIVSSVGYTTDTLQVTSSVSLKVTLMPSQIIGKEIIVAASRVPESILESPVSIEHIDIQMIRQSPTANFYNAIGRLKGVDMVTSGLLFSTPTTRGFGGSGNTGVNQIVDGMNTEAPGLNFSVGNVIGISELDIDKIELLPGASSVLYGSGGTSGTILLTSKNPFQYQGLSVMVKGGIMHINDPQYKVAPYQQYDIRYAHAFNNKFAFKINASYIKAYDWIASDSSNYDATNFTIKSGNRSTDPAYDGVNIYGDETSANMQDVANSVLAVATSQFVAQYHQQTGSNPTQAQINGFLSTNAQTSPFYNGLQAGIIPNQDVSRTGWKEKYLVDYNTYNVKLGTTVTYKITPDTKISLLARYGKGTTVYTGADRYSLMNFHLGQYKIQLDGKHFMLRAYTTQESAGEAYNATVLGQLMNEAWKPSQQWFPEYIGAYVAAKGGGASDQQAFVAARSFADQGIPIPGTSAFEQYKNTLREKPIPAGAAFKDKSSLYQYEGMYNFKKQIPFMKVQVGANYRTYQLNSNGTIFDDKGKKIAVGQYGMFAQLTKNILNDRVKLTGAIRYDKTDNFEGKWTPRIAGVFTIVPENKIRVSYQTGYKLPTNQNQYIDLNVGRARLIGGLPQFIEKYQMAPEQNPVFLLDNVKQYGAAFKQAYLQNIQGGDPVPIARYKAAVAAEPVLMPYRFKPFKPETVRSFEVGYRGIIKKKLMLDAYVYFSSHKDFIGSILLVQAKGGSQQIAPADPQKYYGPQLGSDATRNVYQMYVNSEGTVKTWGWAFGGNYVLPGNYRLSANVSYNKLSNAPEGFFTQYNTPDYRVNIGFGNSNVYKNWGFNINYHYQDAFLYEGSFAVGKVSAFNRIDAQINYRLPEIKVSFKLGGTNILNHYYQNAFGNPSIGGLYYLAVGYNVF